LGMVAPLFKEAGETQVCSNLLIRR
jgi:hypothetical protein